MTSNTVEFVYSSHLFEHLYFSDCEILLSKIYSALKEGGLIRLALPDYDVFIQKFNEKYELDPREAILELEQSLLSHPLKKPNLRKIVWNGICGNLHVHRWHPNYALVEGMLKNSGFTEIKKCSFQESNLPDILLLENRNEETFYIEAKK